MIIGINGRPRRGKDFLAEHLVKHHGFTVYHFADALYAQVRSAKWIVFKRERGAGEKVYIFQTNGLDQASYEFTSPRLCRLVRAWLGARVEAGCPDMTASVNKSEGELLYVCAGHKMTDKDAMLLQWWGTEYRRDHYGSFYWVKRLKEAVEKAPLWSTPHERRIVIPDMRFPNELHWIREQPDGKVMLINSERPFEATGRDASHDSETALDHFQAWDGRLFNDFSPAFLEEGGSMVENWLKEEADGEL